MKDRLIGTTIIFFVLVVTILSFGYPQKTEDPGILLRAAIEKEEVDGDLQAAIGLYQQVIEKSSGNSAVAAQAQLRIGLCYEKLGRGNVKQALEAFRRVVSQYPNQKEAVELARRKLESLRPSTRPSEQETSDFTIKKIWTGPEADGTGKISPDGRFLAYTDWMTGDLAVLDLSTGKKRRLTNKGNWMKSQEFVLFLAWSPDGKQIVYNWWDQSSYIDMRVIGTDGSTPPRTIHKMDNPEFGGAFVIGWIPDERSVLTAFAEEGGTRGRISRVSVDDGSERIIKEMDVRNLVYDQVICASLSPKGRFLAYSFPAKVSNDHNRDIYLLPLEGGETETLIEHPASDLVIGWVPDGKTLLFISDREGDKDVWAVPVKDGKLDEPPMLIKEGIGTITPQGFGQDGSLYYITSQDRKNVYMAQWNPDNGEILKKSERPIKHLGHSTYSPAFSQDGRYLAYVSVRGGGPISEEGHILCIRDLKSGVEREFRTKYNNWGRLSWSPDNRFITGVTRESDGSSSYSLLGMIDTQSGDIMPVFQCEMNRQKQRLTSPDFSKDGQSIYYVHHDDTRKTRRLLTRDLESGLEKEIYRAPYRDDERFVSFLSPDKKQFLLWYFSESAKTNVMHLLPVDGGEARELYRFENKFDATYTKNWSADSRYILFSNIFPEEERKIVPTMQLWRIPVGGGEAQALDLKMVRMEKLSVHPDGKTLVFSSLGPTMKEPTLWKMENFLPEAEDKK